MILKHLLDATHEEKYIALYEKNDVFSNFLQSGYKVHFKHYLDREVIKYYTNIEQDLVIVVEG